MYALKDNSLHGNIHQWYKDADQWWEYMTNETKSVISGIDSQTSSDYHYRMFWNRVKQADKNNIHHYWKHRKDRAEMYDNNGSFYEEYQDRFNDIYDDIEERLLDNEL